jgi:multidrug transporter EmrE-like cation transporter
LQVLAYLDALVGLVETVKRVVNLVLSVVVGRALFGEAVTAPKLVGAGLMAAGVAAILV